MRGVDIQIALLDTPHQGAVEDLLTKAGFYFGGVQHLAFGVDILVVLDLDQLHQYGQASQGFLALGAGQGLDHGATKPVVKGTAAGGVVTTETDNNRQTRHNA